MILQKIFIFLQLLSRFEQFHFKYIKLLKLVILYKNFILTKSNQIRKKKTHVHIRRKCNEFWLLFWSYRTFLQFRLNL